MESWAMSFSNLKSLASLPEADGEWVSKDELIDTVWAGVAGEETTSRPPCRRLVRLVVRLKADLDGVRPRLTAIGRQPRGDVVWRPLRGRDLDSIAGVGANGNNRNERACHCLIGSMKGIARPNAVILACG